LTRGIITGGEESMKSLTCAVVAALTLSEVTSTAAGSGPVTLARSYEPGAVTYYRIISHYAAGGSKGEQAQTIRIRVKEVSQNGQVQLEITFPELPGVTSIETRDRLGRLLSWRRSVPAGGPIAEPIRQTWVAMQEVLFAGKPVSVNDVWETELDSPAVREGKIHFKTTYLGTDEADGVRLWKVKQSASADVGTPGRPMTCELLAWLDPEHGLTVKKELSVSGVPTLSGLLTSTDTVTRLRPEEVAAITAHRTEDRFFTSNGVRIHYVEEGEGEPVLLIHGLGGDLEEWVRTGVLPALARDHRVIAFDLRGHGMSDKPHDSGQYGMEVIEDGVRLLDHLKIAKAHVVGYSMGALIVSALLATHPDRLLSATIGGGGGLQALEDRRFDEIADALEQGKGIGPLISLTRPEGQPMPTEEQIRQMSEEFLATHDPKALVALIRSRKGVRLDEEKLKRNQVPALALVGEHDPARSGVEALSGRMATLKVVVIPAADHQTTPGRPEFLHRLQEFLTEHAQRGSSREAPQQP
jgi:pimeloyl-ACP methyl ester carboxylesterase